MLWYCGSEYQMKAFAWSLYQQWLSWVTPVHVYYCSNWGHIKAVNNLTREQICHAATLRPDVIVTSRDPNTMTTPAPTNDSDALMLPSPGSRVEDSTQAQIDELMQKAWVKQMCWALLLFVTMIIFLLEVNYVWRVSTAFSQHTLVTLVISRNLILWEVSTIGVQRRTENCDLYLLQLIHIPFAHQCRLEQNFFSTP